MCGVVMWVSMGVRHDAGLVALDAAVVWAFGCREEVFHADRD